MGQGGSKPPIRTIRTDDEDEASKREEDIEEKFNGRADTLGVLSEENDYPEPKPPDPSSVKKAVDDYLWDDPSFLASYIPSDVVSQIVSTKSLKELEEFQVELVPVGASFQNHLRRFGIYPNTAETQGSEHFSLFRTYPMTKTVTLTRTTSVRDSLTNSSNLTRDSHEAGQTKREALLAEREKFEQLRLQERTREKQQIRGQVRKYQFDLSARTTGFNMYQTVEDRVADEIADTHRDHRAETYHSLIRDLTTGVRSERLKVKVILAWMSKQNIGRLEFGSKLPMPDTPNGYMMLIQEGQGTFPVFFALLCRAAKLKCAIISGISKGSHYEVGSNQIENLKNTWNAVYVDGSWHLVHPLWVCKGIANRQLGGWMKIEEEGRSMRSLSILSTGQDVSSFNPYFIFTKPEEFICRNFPDEERWQLLAKPLSLDEFLQQTYIRPVFFMNKFKLLSKNVCVYESTIGEPCEVEIEFPKHRAHDVVFGYELSMKVIDENVCNVEELEEDTRVPDKDETNNVHVDENSNNVDNTTVFITNPVDTENSVHNENEDGPSIGKTENETDKILNDIEKEVEDDAHCLETKVEDKSKILEEFVQTERHVFVQKFDHSVVFEVRFSEKGTYKLRLYGGYYTEFGSKPPWIMDLLLICENIIEEPEPLPFDPGPTGWGPGPISESLGLYVPSHADSIVTVFEEEETVMYFVLHERLHVTVELVHSHISKERLQGCVTKRVTIKQNVMTLQITLKIPGDGEYCLRIDVMREGQMVNACNYLLHTDERRPLEAFYQRKARKHLKQAMETWTMEDLQDALEECEDKNIPTDDADVRGALGRLEFLHCKQELSVSLLVNRIDVAEHALYRTRKANLDGLLGREIAKVEEHLQKLLKLDEGGWTCEIPEIDRLSLVELGQLRKPKLEIRIVVICLYMLLGIEEEKLKDWGKVRKLLRNQQSTLVEIARLEKYLGLDSVEEVTVTEEVLDRIKELLGNYSEDQIRRADNTAAAYYQWVTTVTNKLKHYHEQKREQVESQKRATASQSKASSRSLKSLVTKSALSIQSAAEDKNCNTGANVKDTTPNTTPVERIASSKQRDSRLQKDRKSSVLESIEENSSAKPVQPPSEAPKSRALSQNTVKTRSKATTPIPAPSQNPAGSVSNLQAPIPTSARNSVMSNRSVPKHAVNSIRSTSRASESVRVQSRTANDLNISDRMSVNDSRTSRIIHTAQSQRSNNFQSLKDIGRSSGTFSKQDITEKISERSTASKERTHPTETLSVKGRLSRTNSKQDDTGDVSEAEGKEMYRSMSKQSLQISGKTFFSDRTVSVKSEKV